VDDNTKLVIAITAYGPVRFNTLLEALDDKCCDPGTVIYSSWQEFQQSCNPRRLEILCDDFKIEKPLNLGDGRPESKRMVWNGLCGVAKLPREIQVITKRQKKEVEDSMPSDQSTQDGAEQDSEGKKKGAKGRSRTKYADDYVITVLAAKNPKRGTAAKRFDLYRDNMTVAEYLESGGIRGDINWDTKQGFIQVSPQS
jgi:hypothetical protein